MSERGETLTDAMLAVLPPKLRLIRQGRWLRAGCPFHGSDNQRSLYVDSETGRFSCHSCKVWGYTEAAREDWKANHGGTIGRHVPQPSWQRSSGTLRLRPDAAEPALLAGEWLERLAEWQAALPEAANYLAARRIPLELVAELGGAVGTFGNARRLILPHTDAAGRIVSLYGRRIDGAEDHKHHHLPGRIKGALNAQACNGPEVWICEGPFDALALMAAGIPNAVAVFGVAGIRWGWLAKARRVVFAFDVDEAGRRETIEHAKQALMRGAEVLTVTADELGGCKDIAEAWAAGALRLDGIPPLTAKTVVADDDADPVARLQTLVAALPDIPPGGLSPVTWADYRHQCQRFMAEHGTEALTLGWTETELFALPADARRPWEGGALWTFADYEAFTEVTGEHIKATSRGGAAHVLQRCNLEPGSLRRLPWGC